AGRPQGPQRPGGHQVRGGEHGVDRRAGGGAARGGGRGRRPPGGVRGGGAGGQGPAARRGRGRGPALLCEVTRLDQAGVGGQPGRGQPVAVAVQAVTANAHVERAGDGGGRR